MKLSEILKDWPIKSDMDLSWLGGDKKEITEIQHQQSGWNTAITSCDREIDREALGRVIQEEDNRNGGPGCSSANQLKDAIISTMPTWLRKVNKRTQRNENARITRLSR